MRERQSHCFAARAAHQFDALVLISASQPGKAAAARGR
jgi:hypothetical protein